MPLLPPPRAAWQLELLDAVAVYYTLQEVVAGRDVIHWVDNTGAMYALAKAYSSEYDSARIVHALDALNARLHVTPYFEYVHTKANIADLPSRGDFAFLEEELGSAWVDMAIPDIEGWAVAQGTAVMPKKRRRRKR